MSTHNSIDKKTVVVIILAIVFLLAGVKSGFDGNASLSSIFVILGCGFLIWSSFLDYRLAIAFIIIGLIGIITNLQDQVTLIIYSALVLVGIVGYVAKKRKE